MQVEDVEGADVEGGMTRWPSGQMEGKPDPLLHTLT